MREKNVKEERRAYDHYFITLLSHYFIPISVGYEVTFFSPHVCHGGEFFPNPQRTYQSRV